MKNTWSGYGVAIAIVFACALSAGARTAGAQTQTAVEYYHAGWNYYFVTSFTDEIALLDGGAFGGVWHRTGQAFGVWSQPVANAFPACRFFSTSFAPKSSHFYTPSASECASVKMSPDWEYEGIAFHLALPDGSGACAAGTSTLYRVYNDGQGGAPNHRLTTDRATFDQMIAAGWVAEGNGRTGAFACVPQVATPTVGFWWNPTESGRLFFLDSEPDSLQLTSYLFENDGRATWLTSSGPNADPYAYQGRLLGYRNGTTLFGDYKAPSAPSDAGAVALAFTDDTHGAITWPGGTVPIEPLTFGTGVAGFEPAAGWWWNTDESGRDYGIQVQGDSLAIVSSMYDDAGNPVWYYSTGKMATPTTYQGPWLRYANGQTLTGPYRAPSAPTQAGRLAVEFTGVDEAVLTFSPAVATSTADSQQPKRGTIFGIPVVPKKKAPPKYAPPARYDGTFTQSASIITRAGLATTTIDYKVTGSLTWFASEDGELGSLTLRAPKTAYQVFPFVGTTPIAVVYDIRQKSDSLDCKGHFTRSYPLVDAGSWLEVNGFAQYEGKIELTDLRGGEVTVNCVSLDVNIPSPPPFNIPVMIPVSMNIKGPIVYGVNGGPRTTDILTGDPSEQIIDAWSFAEVKGP